MRDKINLARRKKNLSRTNSYHRKTGIRDCNGTLIDQHSQIKMIEVKLLIGRPISQSTIPLTGFPFACKGDLDISLPQNMLTVPCEPVSDEDESLSFTGMCAISFAMLFLQKSSYTSLKWFFSCTCALRDRLMILSRIYQQVWGHKHPNVGRSGTDF